jgi:hypothetical protein
MLKKLLETDAIKAKFFLYLLVGRTDKQINCTRDFSSDY